MYKGCVCKTTNSTTTSKTLQNFFVVLVSVMAKNAHLYNYKMTEIFKIGFCADVWTHTVFFFPTNLH